MKENRKEMIEKTVKGDETKIRKRENERKKKEDIYRKIMKMLMTKTYRVKIKR
jgi:hypothetical protein